MQIAYKLWFSLVFLGVISSSFFLIPLIALIHLDSYNPHHNSPIAGVFCTLKGGGFMYSIAIESSRVKFEELSTSSRQKFFQEIRLIMLKEMADFGIEVDITDVIVVWSVLDNSQNPQGLAVNVDINSSPNFGEYQALELSKAILVYLNCAVSVNGKGIHQVRVQIRTPQLVNASFLM